MSLRLGIFNLPIGPRAEEAAPVDLDENLRRLAARGVDLPPALVADRYSHDWAPHLTAPAADLQRIISIIQNRDTYTLGDRIKKFFGCGIGARAEKYLGDYFGAETKRYLHKLNDGRFNCLLAALVNENNAPLFEHLVRDMATMRKFEYTNHPYTILGESLLPYDKALFRRYCTGPIRGNANALKLLGGNYS